jgi:hypothetical protein
MAVDLLVVWNRRRNLLIETVPRLARESLAQFSVLLLKIL